MSLWASSMRAVCMLTDQCLVLTQGFRCMLVGVRDTAASVSFRVEVPL